MYVGIDPGLSGGFAFIAKNGLVKSLCKMPRCEEGLDLPEIRYMLKISPIDLVTIEVAETRPGLGSPSILTTGRNYGIILGMLAAFEIPTIMVRASIWTKTMCSHQDKDLGPKEKAYLTACEMFPREKNNFIPKNHRVAHDGIIDALLIGEYGRQKAIQKGIL